jgi:hypothetical protein
MNPNKGPLLPPKPPKITLSVLTHWTGDSYHHDRIPVVELCISTMLAGAVGYDYELLIWDNGSSDSFRKKLQTYKPDTLVFSPNIGTNNARIGISNLARGEYWYYTDDDIYHSPDWLNKHMEIITTYPGPAIVSGSPQRTAFKWGMHSNIQFAHKNPGIMQIGRLIPDEVEAQYAKGISRNVQWHMDSTKELNDYLFTYRDVKAWAHAHHMQFLTKRVDILGKQPASEILIDNGREWDMKMDSHGFLRLTTFERTTLHVGNRIEGDVFIKGKE